MARLCEHRQVGMIQAALRGQPYVIPGILASLVIAGAWMLLRRRRCGSRQAIAEALLVAGIGVYVSVCLTPGPYLPWGNTDGQCGLSLLPPVDWRAFQQIDDRSLNVWLCVPAGLMAAVSTRMRPAWIATCVFLPVAAEVIQHFAPVLSHSCQLSDVEDNWQGVLVGAILGGIVLVVRWIWSRSKRTASPDEVAALK